MAADNVTIDFDGFVIDGDGGDGTGVTDGEVSHKSIVVRNGMIRGKAGGSIGIAIYLSHTANVTVDEMILTGEPCWGLYLTGHRQEQHHSRQQCFRYPIRGFFIRAR